MRHKLTLGALTVSIALTTGCATLAPEYQRPAAPVPGQWPGQPTQLEGATQAANLGWRDFFTDPALQRLIQLALANNRDLRVATLNIEQARAAYRIQHANLFPSINASAAESSQRLSESQSLSGESQMTRGFSADLGLASYELDLFGRVRSLKNAALEQYMATGEAWRSAQISLVAEVANAYMTLAADRERLQLAKDTLQSQRQSYDLTQRSYEVGVASELELRQAQTSVDAARVDIAGYTTTVARDRNALNLLLGATTPAETTPSSLTALGKEMPDLPAGMPADVLLRRPDILQAEHELRAANANIGAARAAFFPSITLTGGVGTASDALSGLFEAGSRTWSFIPQLTLPIFNAGRLGANLEVSKLQRDILTARYEQSIQAAFRDIADALALRSTIGDQLAAQRSLTEATEASYRLSDIRYRKGIDSYLNLLDSQRALYAAQQALISTELANATSMVSLYRALGGGWQENTASSKAPKEPRPTDSH